MLMSTSTACASAKEAAGRDRSEVDMTPREVGVDVYLNAGEAEATVWTDDLTHEYVHINADYES